MIIEKTRLSGLAAGLVLAIVAPASAQSVPGGDTPMPVPGPYPVTSSQPAAAPSARRSPKTATPGAPEATAQAATIFPKPSFALPLPYWMRPPAGRDSSAPAPRATAPMRRDAASALAGQQGDGTGSGTGQAGLRAQVQAGASFGGSADARVTGTNRANQAFGLTRTVPMPGYFPGYGPQAPRSAAQPSAQPSAQSRARGTQQARARGAGTGNAPAQTFLQPYANPYDRPGAPQYGYGYAYGPPIAPGFAPGFAPLFGQPVLPGTPFGRGAPTAPGYLPYGYAPYGYGQQPRGSAPARR